MKHGDVVVVATSGDYGKPRPAVVVQSDAMPDNHGSVVVCQMTTTLIGPSDFRVTVEPSATNGLRSRSQIMADKPIAIRRERVGRVVGHLTDNDIASLKVALAFVFGFAD